MRSHAVERAALLAVVLIASGACGDRSSPDSTERAPATPDALTVVVLADLHGVLEPCGCGSRPAGGLDRVAGALAAIRRERTPSLLIATGRLLSGPTRDGALASQDALKRDALIAALAQLGVDVLAPSQRDIADGGDALARLAREGQAQLLSLRAPKHSTTPARRSVLIEVGGHHIGLYLADGAQRSTAARLRQRGAAIVLAIRSVRLPGAATARSGAADVVITPGAVQARELRAETGSQGEALVLVDLVRDAAAGKWRASAVRQQVIDDSVPQDAALRTLLDQVFARINAVSATLEPETRTPAQPQEARYLGARTCAACHTREYYWWIETAHARAHQTLIARGRQLDLDCVGCHVTGFAEPGGARLAALRELAAVGCESCHGPGATHAQAPQLRPFPVQRDVTETKCRTCHDAAHSPRFDYESWRARMLGPGHGSATQPSGISQP